MRQGTQGEPRSWSKQRRETRAYCLLCTSGEAGQGETISPPTNQSTVAAQGREPLPVVVATCQLSRSANPSSPAGPLHTLQQPARGAARMAKILKLPRSFLPCSSSSSTVTSLRLVFLSYKTRILQNWILCSLQRQNTPVGCWQRPSCPFRRTCCGYNPPPQQLRGPALSTSYTCLAKSLLAGMFRDVLFVLSIKLPPVSVSWCYFPPLFYTSQNFSHVTNSGRTERDRPIFLQCHLSAACMPESHPLTRGTIPGINSRAVFHRWSPRGTQNTVRACNRLVYAPDLPPEMRALPVRRLVLKNPTACCFLKAKEDFQSHLRIWMHHGERIPMPVLQHCTV